jgi:PAS domain S-box-containing protein
MQSESREDLLLKIEQLEGRLAESEQLIEAIKAGEVDAFALNTRENPEIFTLQSGDYAYRVLIEEFGEGAVNLSEEGLIVYTNNCFAELLGLTYDQVIGRFISEFIEPTSLENFNNLFTTARKGKCKGEMNLMMQGKIIPVYISLTSLQPKLATVGMIITDQTEKRKHEEVILRYQEDLETKNKELAQSNFELDSFCYIASHDLQEPLRKIQTFCHGILALEGENFSAEAHNHFERIVKASERMRHMIHSLLEYSRMNSPNNEKTPTDLTEIVEDVISNQLDNSKSKANFIVDTLPIIHAIPDQMKQLFANLLSNAVKYRNPSFSPEIRIHSKKENDHWQITVTDNGIGFEPQFADKIFELFQRLHTRFEYEGTGIGLAICKKIVQNHQGIIRAFGTPGKGSSFEINLPVNEEVSS